MNLSWKEARLLSNAFPGVGMHTSLQPLVSQCGIVSDEPSESTGDSRTPQQCAGLCPKTGPPGWTPGAAVPEAVTGSCVLGREAAVLVLRIGVLS